MKRLNKNIILAVFAALFVLAGMFGSGSRQIAGRTVRFAIHLLHGEKDSVSAYTKDVEAFAEELLYHEALVDLHSFKEHLLGTRVIDKGETLVVRSDAETLLGYFQSPLSEEELRQKTEKILEVQKCTEENGGHFLYGSIPVNPFYEQIPGNVTSCNQENKEKLRETLQNAGVPVLLFDAALQEAGLSPEEMFFFTDHHWRPRAGFIAAGAVGKELKARYGFAFDPACSDIGNFNIVTYPDWFLGSYGKKVGTWFTWRGADSFDLITPRFETDLSETDSEHSETRRGRFEESVLFPEHMKRNLYYTNSYLTYCGGDYRLQIITNHQKPDGAKVLLIRDSYSCVLAPFLVLQFGELHIVDDREGSYPPGEKVEIYEYIRKERFDYVLVVN